MPLPQVCLEAVMSCQCLGHVTSHAAVLDLEVNDCELMAVPKVDRGGPTDPPNIICLVVEKKYKLYKLGTKHEMIKRWYGGDCL
ncbi:hypothetical protein QTP88_012739 [Uroleucon formosanum]